MSNVTLTLTAPVPSSRLRRGLAAAQVLKETASALLLVLPVLLGRPWFVAAALPGLVLYGLHGALALGRLRRSAAGLVWGVTLIDELGSWLIRELTTTSPARHYLVQLSFIIGLIISLSALLELAWRWRLAAAGRRRWSHGRPGGRRN